jgi:photosystem II stability/assembly factor-like uncharacterized protein
MKNYLLLVALFSGLLVFGQKKSATTTADSEKKSLLNAESLSVFKFRSIGPALTSGRVADIAVNPAKPSEYYVAVASGGVWKTSNAGNTWQHVLANEGSYSMGCVVLDPNNTNVVWAGSGENNNQRSVAYGDGVYKSEDGGKSWKNVGLKNSEHIGMIAINPKNSNEVFVAAYGPVWSSGGERGIYKTTDGGKTWNRVLFISEHTGFSDVYLDPRDPAVVYASAHQRQRKVYTYIGGGPESALYKSTDGGITWNKIMKGLPSGELGRIGMAISPVNPDLLYCIVEAREGGGVYKSTDRGASWNKQSSYGTSGNYYQELVCDPVNPDKLYSMNVFLMKSLDGGKTWNRYGERYKHVDNHAMWIDPANPEHTLVGCDGGLYETWDDAATWQFKANLPVTQFYKVVTDNAVPFYNVYGGTQDNFSLGGPSRTISANGISNSDWFITNGGDGFESAVDWKDPNIVYAQSQYGGLARYDKKSGENLPIQNIEKAGEPAFRWNWDAPLLVSRHDNKRIYHAAQFVFRSNDRGGSWQTISPDLSRGIDRNRLEIMGKVWSVDAVAKNGSTDIYGQISALSESRLDENVIIAGTDDGLIHITMDGGKTWKKTDKIAGIPDLCYVHTVLAGAHDKNTFYAAFNHHRMGDFKPYLVKSTDGGNTWSVISNNLPERGSTYCIAEDHVNANLLFAGTEFGIFTSLNGGGHWMQMKGGLPTIAVRDIDIQERENDLVIATFGYGFYVLDNYAPLRSLKESDLEQNAFIAPVKDALMYVESMPLGLRGKSFQGDGYFATPNPPVGAVIRYYLKEDIKTIKEKRQAAEKELAKAGKPVYYPNMDSLRMEDRQVEPHLLFTIADAQGNVVRKLKAPAKKGMKQLVWDFDYAPFTPVNFSAFDPEENPFGGPPRGFRALPGDYTVSMEKFEDGMYTQLVAPQPFKAVALNNTSLPAEDKAALLAFNKKVAELQRVVSGTSAYMGDINNRLRFVKEAVMRGHGVNTAEASKKIFELERRMLDLGTAMNGDASLSRREFEALPGIGGLVNGIAYSLWNTSAAPNGNMEQAYQQAAQKFGTVHGGVKAVDAELKALEQQLEKSGAPYTPGRLPDWKG